MKNIFFFISKNDIYIRKATLCMKSIEQTQKLQKGKKKKKKKTEKKTKQQINYKKVER